MDATKREALGKTIYRILLEEWRDPVGWVFELAYHEDHQTFVLKIRRSEDRKVLTYQVVWHSYELERTGDIDKTIRHKVKHQARMLYELVEGGH